MKAPAIQHETLLMGTQSHGYWLGRVCPDDLDPERSREETMAKALHAIRTTSCVMGAFRAVFTWDDPE